MNSSIIEKLYKAGVIDHSRHVNLEALETYTLTHDILVVMHTPSLSHVTLLRAVVEKWTFQDKAMGEQYLTFDYQSEEPVVWQVGDYCIFRGETYTLNYIPSVTQTGGYHKSLSSYKYEGVRMDSYADELTRCQMLDVVLTSGQHDPSAGTNYTGSSRFDLFCGETTVDGVTRTAVMTLGDRMLANLNRMYRDDQDEPLWSIEYGEDTHTEDQRLQFDNQSVVQALAEVKNKFDLNYSIRGRVITIGGTIENVTDVTYGYGEGYPTEEDGGKALFEIKKISDSNQKIVTRLRVLGSTKNLPYRYYNKKYNLPQALFPTALQLPDTFLALGTPDDTTGANTKWGQNKERRADPATAGLRYVLGETNDAYIDKNDNARNTVEGIREATVRFDGSDSKLKEIYPTIEEVLYSELRAAGVEDQDGATGSSAFPGYDGDEYINRLLAVGHKVDGTLTDDANIGNGILSEDNVTRYGDVSDILVSAHQESLTLGAHGWRYGTERTLFTLSGQEQGKYFFTPVAGQEPWFDYSAAHESAQIAFIIRVKQTVSGTTTVIAEYVSDFMSGVGSVMLPSVPDAFFMDDAKVQEIAVTATADITVTFTAVSKAVSSLQYRIGLRDGGTAQYVWSSLDDMDSANMPFHVFVKDMGFDFAAQFNGETPQIVMKGGQCVGRSFQIGENVQKVEYDGKKGYMLTLTRDSDSSLNTYYPSSQAQLSADDPFVLVGIDMPDAYIEAAEMRQLR